MGFLETQIAALSARSATTFRTTAGESGTAADGALNLTEGQWRMPVDSPNSEEWERGGSPLAREGPRAGRTLFGAKAEEV